MDQFNLDFEDESDLIPSFDYETKDLDLSHEVLFGEKCVASPFLPGSISEKILFDDAENLQLPFDFNESLPNTVGRHVRSFNLKQHYLNKPSYLDASKKPSTEILSDETKNKYDNVIHKYDSLLTKLRLNDQNVLNLITKPEMVDVFPTLLNKFSLGEMPVLDDTWMMNPRFVPSAIFDIMRRKGYFTGFSESKRERILYLPNKKGDLVPVKYANGYERENIIRIYMVKHTDDPDFTPIFSNLRHYNFPVYYTCDLLRFYDYDTKLHFNAKTIFQTLSKQPFDEMKDYVFKKMMSSKLFRYNFEDKNKEYLYFGNGFRSSYYRFTDLIEKKRHTFIKKKEINVLYIAPDKDFNDVSVTGAIDAITSKCDATRVRITFISNLVNFGNLHPFVKHNRTLITVGVKSTVHFALNTSVHLKTSDLVFVDFTEIHQVGSMIYGTHGKLNQLMHNIVEGNDLTGKTFFIRTSLSGSLFYFMKASEPLVQLFKAGGMTFQFATQFAQTNFNFDKNMDLLRKVASVKLMTDEDRKKILLRGFGLKYIDSKDPVVDPIGFDLDCPKYNLINASFRPLSYCHSRATNKFSRNKEDLLQYYIDVKNNERDDGALKFVANSLIRNNFTPEEALSEVREKYPAQQASEALVKEAMRSIFKTSAYDPSLLRAVKMTIIDAQTVDKLQKTCRSIKQHLHLFTKIQEGDVEKYIFSGFVPDNMNKPDKILTFFPEVKENVVVNLEDIEYNPLSPQMKRQNSDESDTTPVKQKKTQTEDK